MSQNSTVTATSVDATLGVRFRVRGERTALLELIDGYQAWIKEQANDATLIVEYSTIEFHDPTQFTVDIPTKEG